jgi:hypothetical protein
MFIDPIFIITIFLNIIFLCKKNKDLIINEIIYNYLIKIFLIKWILIITINKFKKMKNRYKFIVMN